MKREKMSSAVPATLIGAIAVAILAGCSGARERQMRNCVDDKGKPLPDEYCQDSRYAGRSYGYPHFIYGGALNGGRYVGGSLTPSSSADIVNSSGSVVRRGFGGSSGGGGFFGG